LLDELWSGVAVVAAPDVEREQSIDHGAYALLVFALPMLGAALLEALASLVAERHSRVRVAGSALLALGAALLACGLVEGRVGLALGLAVAGTASGVVCSVAQAELVSAPGGPERAMLRWALFSEIGDALTPPLTALVLMGGGSYRGVFLVAASLSIAHGLLLFRSERRLPTVAADEAGTDEPQAPASADADDGAEAVPLLDAWRAGVRNRALWTWLLAAALCTFLDEIVIALAALHAERDLGASPAASVACVTGAALGAAAGAVVGDRLLVSVPAGRILVGSALATLVALAGVVLAPSVGTLGASLALLGAAASPQYALLQARAYAAAPGRPGVVNALAQMFVVIDIGAPLTLGALADHGGLSAALACLAIQPLGVLAVLAWARRGRRPPMP
jgi:FSR family fosmidomycin resistance protein-like MFS transporter